MMETMLPKVRTSAAELDNWKACYYLIRERVAGKEDLTFSQFVRDALNDVCELIVETHGPPDAKHYQSPRNRNKRLKDPGGAFGL